MWSTIGSLRESAERRLSTARETALAAAQVAQDVLNAAATEENDSPTSPPHPNDADWQQWQEDLHSQGSSPQRKGEMSASPARGQQGNANPHLPPVPLHAPPPPPPSGSDGLTFPHAGGKKRPPRARYVVTGKETASTTLTPFLAPPRPSYTNFGGTETSKRDDDTKSNQALQDTADSKEKRDADQMAEVPTGQRDMPSSDNRGNAGDFETLPQTLEAGQNPSGPFESVSEESKNLNPDVSQAVQDSEVTPMAEHFTDWLQHQEPAPDVQHQESALGTEEWPGASSFPEHVGNGFANVDSTITVPGEVSGEKGTSESFFNRLSQQPVSVPLKSAKVTFCEKVEEQAFVPDHGRKTLDKTAEEYSIQQEEIEIAKAPARDIAPGAILQAPRALSSAPSLLEQQDINRQSVLRQERNDAMIQISDLRKELTRLQAAQLSKAETVAEQEFAIRNLKEDLQVISLERDTAIASKELVSRELENLKREVLELGDEVADCKDDTHRALAERDQAKMDVQHLHTRIEEITLERDAAVETGHNGLREARNALESTDTRQAALLEEVETLRKSLQRVSLEKNEAQLEAEQLRLRHQVESETSDVRVKEFERRLAEALDRVSTLEAERDEALAASGELLEEQRKLMSETQVRTGQLTEKENELRELERALKVSSTERDNETVRLEALAAQLSEMKESMEASIQERNNLHSERIALNEDLEKALCDLSLASANAAESERKMDSVVKQRQEGEARIKLLQGEVEDLRLKCDNVVQERDSLIRGRTAAVADLSNLPASMKALTQECESKTNEISLLQRQMKSATAKIAKLTAQRNTILRQRDDAGSRLSAAGAEFSSLNAKLKRLSASNVDANNTVRKLQDERDELRQKIAEFAADAAKGEALETALLESRAQREDVETELSQVKQNLARAEEARVGIENELQLTKAELKRLGDVHTVVSRELEASRLECSASAEREQTMQSALGSEKESLFESNAALSQAQAELRSSAVRFEQEKNALRSELAAERAAVEAATAERDSTLESLHDGRNSVSSIRKELELCVQDGCAVLREISGPDLPMPLQSDKIVHNPEIVNKLPNMSVIEISKALGRMHQEACQKVRLLVEGWRELLSEKEQLRISQIEQSEKNSALEQHMAALNLSLADLKEKCSQHQTSEHSLQGLLRKEKESVTVLESEKRTLLEDLEASRAEIEKLRDEVDSISTALAAERSTRDVFPPEEKQKLLDTLRSATEVTDSMWSLVQGTLSSEIVQNISANHEETAEGESLSRLGPMSLQGIRVLASELGRLREVSAEYDEKLAAAQREIETIWERTEIAESERDSARAARDRWEREASTAHERGIDEGTKQAQDQLADLEQELMTSRQDVSILQESLEKSETESSELRSLCSKLTSQFNSRTNELDETEEKLAYLQDHVASLEEDLEVAQQRAQSGEKQSGEAHRLEIERISSELSASQEHAAGLEEEVIKLRDENEKTKNSLREVTLLAETHKTAEENLQIAIEQLEAEQDSLIERKTLELQKKLDESLAAAGTAEKKMSEASVVMNKLALRDEEITELRTALGRLADERVELKLELEKSLSRLNHPDGGGQLVDRRVIRQLLVNYFRVGMARRRDVLELMARMLGFSEADLVAVGLKRVALMERIGSLVQPPDLDGNSLPPLGTVSDKWIEFLMKETDEVEEDF